MSAGSIVQVIGAVVDVEFSRDDMPRVFNALTVDGTDITLEVQQQLGDGVVRTIAMGSSEGSMGTQISGPGMPPSTAKFAMSETTKVFNEAGEVVKPGSGSTPRSASPS